MAGPIAAPRTIQPANHPLPLLLYLEWALLTMAAVSEMTPTLIPAQHASPVVAIASIVGFGLLGLRLPTGALRNRILHILGQFGLILLASQTGLAGLRLFPLLYVVLAIRSCLLLGIRGRLVVVAAAFMVFLGMVQLRVRSLDGPFPGPLAQRLTPFLIGIRVNLVLLFAILLIFVLLLVNALLAERQRRDQLHQAHQQLQASAARMEQLAMAQERSRIAREIHDALGHSLTGLNIQLEGALRLWTTDSDRAHQFVTQAKHLGSTALQDVRQAVSTLRESPLQSQGLEPAIAALAQHFQQTTGVCPQLTLHCPPLPQPLQITVYRILQEALTNACKYASATALAITLKPVGPAPGQLHIAVMDNGVGFDPDDNTTGFGLQGMQERAMAVGGTFQLTSSPHQGCTIQVWLPLGAEVL